MDCNQQYYLLQLKRQRMAFEKQQAEEERSRGSDDDQMKSLQLALAEKKSSREKDFNNFFDALEQKYAKGGSASKAKKGTRTSARKK